MTRAAEEHTCTYVAASVHLLEAVQVGFESSQVLLLHVAKQVLDGQRGHLDGGGGVHVCPPSAQPCRGQSTISSERPTQRCCRGNTTAAPQKHLPHHCARHHQQLPVSDSVFLLRRKLQNKSLDDQLDHVTPERRYYDVICIHVNIKIAFINKMSTRPRPHFNTM